MPLDLGVLKKLDKPRLGQSVTKSTGNTTFSWEAYLGDLQLNGINDLITVDGATKLGQGIFKIVLTPKGSNPDDPNYGTNMPSLIGGKIGNDVYATITSEIIDALTYYNLLNQDNPNSDEVIETIDNVRVVQNIDDPRGILFQIEVTTESGVPVRIQVPQIL